MSGYELLSHIAAMSNYTEVAAVFFIFRCALFELNIVLCTNEGANNYWETCAKKSDESNFVSISKNVSLCFHIDIAVNEIAWVVCVLKLALTNYWLKQSEKRNCANHYFSARTFDKILSLAHGLKK